MTKDTNLTQQLKHYFGFDKFKGDQEAIIRNLLEGHDTFVLMPTGGGKSLCYQLPSLIMEGTAIVISPLIALMKNQVDVINGLSEEVGVAHYLNSSLNKAAIQQVMDDVRSGRTKLLYVAPESLNKEENVEFLQSVKVSFYAIDEAHCISEWGHDFRPEYRNIRPTINKIGTAPIIALTATATDKVRSDIKKSLGITDAKEFKSSFNRANLYYEVRPKTNDVDKQIIKFIRQHEGKSGIIYCLSRKKVEELAEVLKANEIKAAPYHAGLDSATRSQTQDDFLMERIDVIVATIAFGMGIDKPDVRFVIHYDIPKSLEGYYQETGRAGRDGEESEAIMIYHPGDLRQYRYFIDESDASEKYRELQYQKLQSITDYANTGECLQQFIVQYFGQNCEPCGKCSNCLNQDDLVDITADAKKVIAMIYELDGRFGKNVVAQCLTGSDSQKMRDINAKQYDHFGSLKLNQKETVSLIDYMIASGYLEIEGTKYPLVHVTNRGWDVLDNKLTVKRRIAKVQKKTYVFDQDEDTSLFEVLRKKRWQIAQKQKVPAFMIFSDRSLHDMAKIKPRDQDEFLEVNGVGEAKMKKYGDVMLQAIQKYADAK